MPRARQPTGPRPAAPPTQAPARANTTRGKPTPGMARYAPPISKSGGTRFGRTQFPAAAPRRKPAQRPRPQFPREKQGAAVSEGRQERGPRTPPRPDTGPDASRTAATHPPRRSLAKAVQRVRVRAGTCSTHKPRCTPASWGNFSFPPLGKKSSALPAPRAVQRIFRGGKEKLKSKTKVKVKVKTGGGARLSGRLALKRAGTAPGNREDHAAPGHLPARSHASANALAYPPLRVEAGHNPPAPSARQPPKAAAEPLTL